MSAPSPRDPDAAKKAALLLATGHRVRFVAEQIGVTERTVRGWKRNPRFQAVIEGYRSEAIAALVGRLSEAGSAAASALTDLLKSEDENIRLRAAIAIIDRLPATDEYFKLSERVRKLEERNHEHENI